MIYLIPGILIVAFLLKAREWREKAAAWDKHQDIKASVYLPSMEELIRFQNEEKWNRIFRSFYKETLKFIRAIKIKRQTSQSG